LIAHKSSIENDDSAHAFNNNKANFNRGRILVSGSSTITSGFF